MPKMNANARRALVQDRQAQILAAATRSLRPRGMSARPSPTSRNRRGSPRDQSTTISKNKGDLLLSLPRQVIQPPIQAFGHMAGQNSPEETLTAMARFDDDHDSDECPYLSDSPFRTSLHDQRNARTVSPTSDLIRHRNCRRLFRRAKSGKEYSARI